MKNKSCQLIDPASPFGTRIGKKEEEKYTNYNDLKCEIARMWKMKKVDVIPIVIGALGAVTKDFDKLLKKLELDLTVEMLQKCV